MDPTELKTAINIVTYYFVKKRSAQCINSKSNNDQGVMASKMLYGKPTRLLIIEEPFKLADYQVLTKDLDSGKI